MRFSIKKKIISKVMCSLFACVMLVSVHAFSAFAYPDGFFNYDKYSKNTAKYEIKETLENKYVNFNWNDNNKTTTEFDSSVKYVVCDISTDKHYNPDVLKQRVYIHFELPDVYTDFYKKNRQCRLYSYERWTDNEPPKIKDEISDENFNDGFGYHFYYSDTRPNVGTEATVIGDESCSPFFITIFSENDDQTPSFEEAVAEKLNELEAEKARYEESDKKSKNYKCKNDVIEENYGDRVVLTFFRRVETPEYGTKTPKGKHNAPHEMIEHWHYREEREIYEIKRIKEFPDLYLINEIRERLQENYEIGENQPIEEAVELHNLLNERYSHTKNVVLPALTNVQYEIVPGEIEYFDKNEEPVNIVINSDADDGKGNINTEESGGNNGEKKEKVGGGFNETSTEIPAAIFISVTGGAVAAGAAGAAEDKKKKKEKPKSTYRLAINKNFGNTIRMQGSPVYVYARIIEVTPEGHEMTRADLSEKIQIYAGSAGINVEDAGMADGYRAAKAFAPRSEESECIIAFRFNYEGNSYTNNVRFFLEEPGVIFYQENLAWPAKSDKRAEVPFTIFGFDPNISHVNIRMSEGSPYDAQLVPSENDPETFWAVLTDICDKDQEAGTVAESFLIVTVSDNEVTIEEQFLVSRVGLGLTFAMPALNCYRVPKKSAEGKKLEDLTVNDFEAATTIARTMLILFDEEQQRVVQLPANPKFELVPILNDDISQERIDALGLKTKLMKVEEGYSEVVFYCEKGWLEPPVRFRMNVKATWDFGEAENRKTYTCEKQVLMRSQPLKKYKNEDARTKEYKNSDLITEKLYRMTALIVRNNWFDELGELYTLAWLMMKYFNDNYGYDEIQVAQVLGTFNKFLGYRQEKLEYIAEKENYKADIKNDDLMHSLAYRAKIFDSFPMICARIALGIATAGATEIILTPLDIVKSGVEYKDEHLPREQTTWGKLWAGVKPPVLGLAIGLGLKGIGIGVKYTYQGAKRVVPKIAGYTAKQVAKSSLLPKSLKNGIEKAGKYFDEMAEKVDDCDPRNLKGNASAAEQAMEQAIKNGENSADDILKSLSGDLSQLEKLEELAIKAGNKEGSDLLKALKIAIDNYRLSGNSKLAEGALRENIIKMCRNKYAIEQMIKENPGQADVYRRLFTKFRAEFFYEPVKKESRQYIADMLGCSVDDIQIKSVSGNSNAALEKGLTIGHDLDVTYIYKSKSGKLIELPQVIAEDALYKTGCKKAGLNFKNFAEAKELAESLQLHACQPTDAERLPEVEKILDKYFRTTQLSPESVPKFKNAEIAKTVPLFQKGAAKIQQAVPTNAEVSKLTAKLEGIIKGKISAGAAERAVIDGAADMKDALRAASKGGGLVTGKGIGAMTVSGESGLNAEFHTIMAICDKAKSGKISPVMAKKALAKMGYDTETALNEAFSQIENVNKNLGVSNVDFGIGASAAGSAMGGRSDSD